MNGKQKKALRVANYELFQVETLNPPAPATIDHKIREADRQARPERHEVPADGEPVVRTEVPPVEELYRLFDKFNWQFYGGKLPGAKIEYSDRMTSAGSYSPSKKLIKIGRKYHEIFPQDLEDTLKHEMIHIIHYKHDANFKTEAKRIGASLRAREHPALRRTPKYLYVCPGCRLEYPRQKRLVMASCGKCSRGRKFDPRFKLKRVKTVKRGVN